MQAQQTRIEVISNNLANVNTTGFKRSRAHFEDLLYQTHQGSEIVEGADSDTVAEIQIGRGTRLAAVQRVDVQGTIELTGRPLDIAIEGQGFFQVQLPDGTNAYTRDGSFTISDRGTLVTHGGYTVSPGINIPPDSTEDVQGLPITAAEDLGEPNGFKNRRHYSWRMASTGAKRPAERDG